VGQFHFDADTYLAVIRAEVPNYDRLQQLIGQAIAPLNARAVLDLGSGTGVTAAQVMAAHPDASLVGIDSSADMLEHAKALVPAARFIVSRLEDPLPPGPYGVVTSALAIHHLGAEDKADLFRRVAAVLTPGGWFVFGDVIVPDDLDDQVTPLAPEYDHPSRLGDQLAWLCDAGLRPSVVWSQQDLAVVVADKVTD